MSLSWSMMAWQWTCSMKAVNLFMQSAEGMANLVKTSQIKSKLWQTLVWPLRPWDYLHSPQFSKSNLYFLWIVPLCVTSEVARKMDKFEVRGELIMSKAEFERLNTGQKDGGEREFSNPRNLVAGILNRKTVPSLGSSKKPLDLICYSLLPATDGT